MQSLTKDTVIIHGVNGKIDKNGKAIRGADKLAAECALELGLVIDLPPTKSNRWGGYPYLSKFGLAGGPIRNTQMLNEGKPDEVRVFHDDIWNSKGSRNMVEQSLKSKLQPSVYVFTEDGCKHRATWEPNLQEIELHFESFGLGVLHKYPNHYGPAVGKVEIEDAEIRLKQLELGLPQHTGTCDCYLCNEAYGKRRQHSTREK